MVVELGLEFIGWVMLVESDDDAVVAVLVDMETVLVVVVTKLIRFTRFELFSLLPVVMFKYCEVTVDDEDGSAVVVAPVVPKPRLLLIMFTFFGLLAVKFTFELAG
jgi:hypothetical protein